MNRSRSKLLGAEVRVPEHEDIFSQSNYGSNLKVAHLLRRPRATEHIRHGGQTENPLSQEEIPGVPESHKHGQRHRQILTCHTAPGSPESGATENNGDANLAQAGKARDIATTELGGQLGGVTHLVPDRKVRVRHHRLIRVINFGRNT